MWVLTHPVLFCAAMLDSQRNLMTETMWCWRASVSKSWGKNGEKFRSKRKWGKYENLVTLTFTQDCILKFFMTTKSLILFSSPLMSQLVIVSLALLLTLKTLALTFPLNYFARCILKHKFTYLTFFVNFQLNKVWQICVEVFVLTVQISSSR